MEPVASNVTNFMNSVLNAPVTGHSNAQVALAFFFIGIASLWAYSECLHFSKKERDPGHDHDEESVKVQGKTDAKLSFTLFDSHVIELLLLNPAALLKSRLVLRAWSELGLILSMFYVCDRTDLFTPGGKSYNRDLFIFICLAILAAFGGFSTHSCKPAFLNRDQTEEWKGWMQILFLLYHYFEAKEMYNAIRIFIACYVWMTGFGNFSYYYIRQDFSLGRFCQMMWRLNFFVLFCCIALRNSYVLYYICPMHTLFTVMLYLVLRIYPKSNATNIGVLAKIILSVVVVYAIWDVPGVFQKVWGPTEFLFSYVDPKKPNDPPLKEWQFRSGLDRYVWIYGMLCAYCHPLCAWLLEKLSVLEKTTRYIVKAVIVTASLGALSVWYQRVYTLDKYSYNALHPFTSWIPITIWIILRNLTPTLRGYYIESLAWMGKITLETYISQFHIWLHSGAPDAQPGKLWVVFRNYPMVNFMFATACYVIVSKKIFDVTNTLKNACVPLDDNALIFKNTATAIAIGTILFFVATGVESFAEMNILGGW